MSSQIRLLTNGPRQAELTVALTHGAGAAMDTPFMDAFAEGLANLGHRIVRFEFPYMAERRESGKRQPPNRLPVLQQTWTQVIGQLGAERLVIGGKSMGGRIASLVADASGARGLVCLGYPFHPTGKPDQLRIDHLQQLQTPTLMLQGTRDPFGRQDEVRQYPLDSKINLHWLEDGDHGFKPRKASGRTEQENWQEAIQAIHLFLTNDV